MSQWHQKARRNPDGRAKFYIRIFRRDHGICKMCGKDNVKLFELLKRSSPELRYFLLRFHDIHQKRFKQALVARFGRLWEIDHIVPLSDEGPDTYDNVRTLCSICHKAITKVFLRHR